MLSPMSFATSDPGLGELWQPRGDTSFDDLAARQEPEMGQHLIVANDVQGSPTLESGSRTHRGTRKRRKEGHRRKAGSWSADEDQRLREFMSKKDKPGKNVWAAASKAVRTRKPDQCSKRWKDALDPQLVHTPWTESEDAKLQEAYSDYGSLWTEIKANCFPTRSGLELKNRWDHISRLMKRKEGSSHRSARPRARINTLDDATPTGPQGKSLLDPRLASQRRMSEPVGVAEHGRSSASISPTIAPAETILAPSVSATRASDEDEDDDDADDDDDDDNDDDDVLGKRPAPSVSGGLALSSMFAQSDFAPYLPIDDDCSMVGIESPPSHRLSSGGYPPSSLAAAEPSLTGSSRTESSSSSMQDVLCSHWDGREYELDGSGPTPAPAGSLTNASVSVDGEMSNDSVANFPTTPPVANESSLGVAMLDDELWQTIFNNCPFPEQPDATITATSTRGDSRSSTRKEDTLSHGQPDAPPESQSLNVSDTTAAIRLPASSEQQAPSPHGCDGDGGRGTSKRSGMQWETNTADGGDDLWASLPGGREALMSASATPTRRLSEQTKEGAAGVDNDQVIVIVCNRSSAAEILSNLRRPSPDRC